MPAKSKAQFHEMFMLYEQGKITRKQLDDFTLKNNVDFSHLPEKKQMTHYEHKKMMK